MYRYTCGTCTNIYTYVYISKTGCSQCLFLFFNVSSNSLLPFSIQTAFSYQDVAISFFRSSGFEIPALTGPTPNDVSAPP